MLGAFAPPFGFVLLHGCLHVFIAGGGHAVPCHTTQHEPPPEALSSLAAYGSDDSSGSNGDKQSPDKTKGQKLGLGPEPGLEQGPGQGPGPEKGQEQQI